MSIDSVKAWKEFKCPVCGSDNFSNWESKNLMRVSDLTDAMKGRIPSEYKVAVKECRDCGYVVMKKTL